MVIDLTQVISPNMPVYPGTEKPKFIPANSYEKDGFKETIISMFTHTGTHIDPPAHIIKGKLTLDKFPASQFVGKAIVIDCRDLPEGGVITIDRLYKHGELLNKAEFLLFNLGWDKFWGTDKYFGDYACIDNDVLEFIINSNLKGIGFDVIGLDPIKDVELTRHNKLFKAKDIINIENLKNLDLLYGGLVDFACLPLNLEDCDGAPARAIAVIKD